MCPRPLVLDKSSGFGKELGLHTKVNGWKSNHAVQMPNARLHRVRELGIPMETSSDAKA